MSKYQDVIAEVLHSQMAIMHTRSYVHMCSITPTWPWHLHLHCPVAWACLYITRLSNFMITFLSV